MNPAYLLLLGLVLLIATIAPPAQQPPGHTPGALRHADDLVPARRAVEDMTLRIGDIQRGRRDSAHLNESVGSMWMSVDRLKREGESVRSIEYYLSDLEGSLRLGEQGAVARRHAANNLDYEIEALKRRLGR